VLRDDPAKGAIIENLTEEIVVTRHFANYLIL
jgi:hypothetical protein